MAETGSLITDLLAPTSYVWLVLGLGIVYFIFAKYMDSKGSPDQRPGWGAKVRKEIIEKEVKERADTFGIKSKKYLSRGIDRIGKIIKVEVITKKSNPDKKEYLSIQWRKDDLTGRIMAMLGKHKHIILDPDAVEINQTDFIIDPSIMLSRDSGIWTTSTQKERTLINDINLQKNYEEVLGQSSDFSRKLSNLHPSQAIFTERQDLAASLEDRSKQAKIKQWTGSK